MLQKHFFTHIFPNFLTFTDQTTDQLIEKNIKNKNESSPIKLNILVLKTV